MIDYIFDSSEGNGDFITGWLVGDQSVRVLKVLCVQLWEMKVMGEFCINGGKDIGVKAAGKERNIEFCLPLKN